MENNAAHVSRRVIGKVNIFDLFGNIEGEWCEQIKAYITSYIKECHFRHVILNIQSVDDVKTREAHGILTLLALPKKSAVYFDSPSIMDKFIEGYDKRYDKKKPRLCNSRQEIIKIFGRELIERDKVIHFENRRGHIRIKAALTADIAFIERDGHRIESDAIITNLSETGLFAEYLDLKSSFTVQNLDYFKNLTLHIKMQNPGMSKGPPIEHKGHILRIEFTGRQAGMAVKFED